MKNRGVLLIAFGTAGLLAAGCATSAVTKNSAAVPTAAAPANIKGALPTLRIGMTAEEVQRIVGKPAEITPLDSSVGSGETWTYRRVLDERTTPDPVTTTHISAFNGLPSNMGAEPQMQYRLKRTVTYQETALLIFDGKLVSSKQRIATSVSYDS